MRLNLEDELTRLAFTNTPESSVTAETVAARVAGSGRRTAWLVLAAVATVAALVAGFVLWDGAGTQPVAPSPSPSTSQATPAAPESTTSTDANGWTDAMADQMPPNLELDPREVARRCEMVPGEVNDPSFEPPLMGATIHIFRSVHETPTMGTTIDPTTKETFTEARFDEARTRMCALGYRDAPVKQPITADELSEKADWKAVCARHSGYPFSKAWTLLGVDAMGSGPARQTLAVFTTRGGDIANCQLSAGSAAAELAFWQRESATQGCFPEVYGWPDAIDATASEPVVKQLTIRGVATMDKLANLHPRQVRISTKGVVLGTYPVANDAVVLNRLVEPSKRLVLGDNESIHLRFEMLDDKGKVVQQCTQAG